MCIRDRVYPEPAVNGIDIDTFNTKWQGRLASILIMEDADVYNRQASYSGHAVR